MSDFPAVVYIKTPRAYSSDEKIDKSHDPEIGPVKKKFKSYKAETHEKKHDSLKDLLENFNKEITMKLENIERRVDILAENYDSLEQKFEVLSSAVTAQRLALRTTVVPYSVFSEENVATAVPISSRVTFITLNREEDYPDGSWLGNPDNMECRVRCRISPTELFHIHTTCTTAEKMALTLLDHLFDRETQACSNISGMGKHKKKQLDPLFIYGIKCHLNFHFGITDQDWNKIKQNVDSKCRTAFRRKMKGLPLIPKGTPHKAASSQMDAKQESENSFMDSQSSLLGSGLSETEIEATAIDFQDISAESEANILERAIKEAKGDFQILHATPEEVAGIQQTHQIQLFGEGNSSLTVGLKVQDNSSLPESPL